MKHSIAVIRGHTVGALGDNGSQSVLPVTRGNADLLAKIARRALELEGVRTRYGATDMTAKEGYAGALVTQVQPLSTFELRRVHINCGSWGVPVITLESPDGEYMRLVRENFVLRDLAEPSSLPLNADIGEVACTSCSFTNTREGLQSAKRDYCPHCGATADAILSGHAEAEAA